MQKFIILCIIRISNFTAGVMTRPICFGPAETAVPNNKTVVCLSLTHTHEDYFNCDCTMYSDRTLWSAQFLRCDTASLRGYGTPPFGETWSSRRPVTACMHKAIVTATVGATVGAVIVPCPKTHDSRTAGHEFDRTSEANIGLWRRPKDRMEALPWPKMLQRGQAAVFPELECQLVE